MKIRIEHRNDPLIALSQIRSWLRDWQSWAKSRHPINDLGWTKRTQYHVCDVLDSLYEDDASEIVNR